MVSKAKDMSEINGKEFLKSAFSAEQEVLRLELELSSKSITHNGVMGEVNERHFISVLRKYLPNRYAVDSAIVIDSNGSTSDQVDIVIYDPQYTPTLLDQHNHRFVVAEAVYAVIEVKPVIDKDYLLYAGAKAASVRRLERTTAPITHATGEPVIKPPFPIIAGIVATTMGWSEGFSSTAFNENWGSLDELSLLDFGLSVSGDHFDTFDGNVHIGPSDSSLAYFIFRLLHKLNSLGTVPAVDWNKYASNLTKPS